MGTRIGEGNYFLIGLISFDIIFRTVPSIGKCELMIEEVNGTVKFPHYTLETEECLIPKLFYSDPIKRNYTYFPSDLEKCPNSDNRLLNNNRTHIWVEESNLAHYNIVASEKFRCCYKSFYLSDNVDEGLQGKDHNVKYEDCIIFHNIIEAADEFVTVFCYYNSSIIYNQLFAFFIDKQEKQETKKENAEIDNLTTSTNKYNVIILGKSSISRLNYHRTMTKTIEFLKEKDTVEFVGYNRYGPNRLENFFPLLLGKHYDEFTKMCHIRHVDESHGHCTHIWDRFKERGFTTALVEDFIESSMSSRFNNSPTDYFFKPLIMESDERDKLKYPVSCTGDKYTYKIMLEYVEHLCTTLQSKLFGFFWQSSMSTKGINHPIATDSDYETLLKNLDKSGYLNETFLILLSDIGSGYGESSENYLEERLPFFKIILPPSFSQNYTMAYNNLRVNTNRLVTVLDIYATLGDLANLDSIKDEEILIKNEKNYMSQRAISLFLPIPSNRTCQAANLTTSQCTCYKKEPIYNLSGLTASYTANLITPEINRIIDAYPQCKTFTLDRLVKFSKLTAFYTKESKFLEYTVRVKTSPEGIFEAIVRFERDWSVVSLINRLDYDAQKSTCVDDPFVKIYCLCKPLVMMRLVSGPIF